MSLHEWTTYAAHINREDGEITLDQLTGEEFSDEELARLLLSAQAYATAAAKVSKAIGKALADRIDKPMEIDGYLIWKGQSSKTVCTDPEGFAEWMVANPREAARAFNPNSVRIGSVPEAVRDTFFEKQRYGVVEVKAAPVEMLR